MHDNCNVKQTMHAIRHSFRDNWMLRQDVTYRKICLEKDILNRKVAVPQ